MGIKCKNHFSRISLPKWIDLYQTEIKMISGPFYT